MMNVLTILAGVFQTLAQCVEGAFLLLAQVGGAIYLATSALVGALATAGGQAGLFLRILCEDNAFIVTRQIPGLLADAAAVVGHQLGRCADALGSACGAVAALAAGTGRATSAALAVLASWAAALEAGLAFAGETSWLIVTFVPVHLPQLAARAAAGGGAGAAAAWRAAARWACAWSATSACGLVLLAIVAAMAWRGRTALYWWWWRAVRMSWYAARGAWAGDAVGPVARSAARRSSPAGAAESPCVVCRERHKCVLTLPCRHVCLCRECCDTLCGYRRACPLCRTFIYRSVDVYL